ncbi:MULTISPECIES: GNAT family N-acetyltransferase [unclassified Nocardioides]|uniref:GNAT family N-acetyltransferase n=1 Tax=unclassified Nocardioides TaxID=2615069 RepID=UPI000057159E|nr:MULTISPECIES: GNAT family N-acetyltransferase [unclassified Nocardioides]ABL82859.1 GCN5-related N-acetyltransferase [Nocardioides sp. JS614]
MIVRCGTDELSAVELVETRALLDAAFTDFSDHDWSHALGGVHALAVEEGRVLAHGSVVPRRLLQGGHPLHCGYVEAVAVRPDVQRRGLGSAVMTALEDLAPAYDLLALSASARGVPLYRARGWSLWRGPSSVLTLDGPVPTPDDDGSIYVLPGASGVDLDGPITCDWRDGDVW